MSDRNARARRPNGGGSVTTRTDGALIVRAVDPATGRRVKRIIQRVVRDDGRPETPAQYRRRAEDALTKLRADLGRPSTLRERWTVERYATERYLPSIVETTTPLTAASYANELRLYVFPHVGAIELTKLAADDVDQLDCTLAAKGYSLVVRRKARGGLGRVLRHAVRKRRIVHDVTRDADRLARDDRDRTKRTLQPEQVRSLLTAARGTPWAAAVTLLGLLGLRRGELLGLSWQHIDLDAGTLTIAGSMVTVDGVPTLGTPKTAGSRRTLTIGPAVVALLRAHRVRQAEQALAAGPFWTGAYVDDRGEKVNLVFVDEAGRPLPGHRVNDALNRLARDAGIADRVTPHVLRHSAASLMIGRGMDVAAVAAVLGHASPAVTTAVYAHALSGRTARATAEIAEAVGPW